MGAHSGCKGWAARLAEALGKVRVAVTPDPVAGHGDSRLGDEMGGLVIDDTEEVVGIHHLVGPVRRFAREVSCVEGDQDVRLAGDGRGMNVTVPVIGTEVCRLVRVPIDPAVAERLGDPVPDLDDPLPVPQQVLFAEVVDELGEGGRCDQVSSSSSARSRSNASRSRRRRSLR